MVLKKRGKGIVEIKVTEDEKELILRCIEFYRDMVITSDWFSDKDIREITRLRHKIKETG